MNLKLAYKILTNLMDEYMINGVNNKVTVMLRGPAGIGKSQIWQQAFRDINKTKHEAIKNKFGIDMIDAVDYRLVLYNPIDIKGAPFIKNERTSYAPMDRFKLDDMPQLIVFEEFDKASRDVQNAALEILYDNAIDGKPFSQHTMMLATANRLMDNAFSKPLSNALMAGRTVVYDISFDYKIFIEYVEKYFHPLIYNFLLINKNYAFDSEASSRLENNVYYTPRSWEKASQLFKHLNIEKYSPNEITHIITGAVGPSAGSKFASYYQIFSKISINEFINGGSIGQNMTEGIINSVLFTYKFIDTFNNHKNKLNDTKYIDKLLKLTSDELFEPISRIKLLRHIYRANKKVVSYILQQNDTKLMDIINEIKQYKTEMGQ